MGTASSLQVASVKPLHDCFAWMYWQTCQSSTRAAQHSGSSADVVAWPETAVLEAAALDWQPSSGGSGGEGPAPRRRGAKPKYICATQEEAVAKRWAIFIHSCELIALVLLPAFLFLWAWPGPELDTTIPMTSCAF